MKPLLWFRMYAEFATDPVVQALSFDDQRHFVMVLCLKAMGLLDREFPDPDRRNNMLHRALGLYGKAFQETQERLESSGLIDGMWQPANWDKRQFKSDIEDPTAAERMRRYRNAHRNSGVTPGVTQRFSESESETETEKKLLPDSRASRATRIPNDLKLTEEMRGYALKQGVQGVDATFEAFCDYWRAESGSRARKHDWVAAWRTWCRKAPADQQARVPSRRSPDPQSAKPKPPECKHGLDRTSCVYCRNEQRPH